MSLDRKFLIFWGSYEKIRNFKGGYENFRGQLGKKLEFQKLTPSPLGLEKTPLIQKAEEDPEVSPSVIYRF